MCGIFGAIGFKDTSSLPLQSLIHRGPDDFGEYIYKDKQLYLGHRRLSIIDLSRSGRQPMKLNDDNLFIIYNGEFYNYLDIKNQFFSDSYFQSKTDTEVILHLYKKFNYRTPEYMRGMFAFCIYDKDKNELYLCRDRCGIKPLYYYFKDGFFAFSSELCAFKLLNEVNLEIDPIGLDHYFSFGYIPSPLSSYKYIRKLSPGTFLIYDIEKKSIKNIQSYWNVCEKVKNHNYNNEKEWIENIESKIKESAAMHLISDVPVGVFLSGGIDSSIIVSKVSEVSTQPVKTFTIGFENKYFDERYFANIVSQRFKTEHKTEVVNPDAIEILPRLLSSFGEPFSDSSAIPTYYVSKMARKHVTVVLSGDGGDEVFSGYDVYKRMYKYLYLSRIPISFRRFLGNIGKYLPSHIKGYGFLQRQAYSNIELYLQMVCCFSEQQKEGLYSADFKNMLARSKINLFQQIIDENHCQGKELITKLQVIDLNSYLPDDILTKVDRMSMQTSLETRVPLLDHELIELVFACPAEIRFKSNTLKYILKSILSKYLPTEVICRRKQGFAVPLSTWFRNELTGYYNNLINNLKSDSFIDYRYARYLFDLHQKKGRDFSKYLYNIMVYKYWESNA